MYISNIKTEIEIRDVITNIFCYGNITGIVYLIIKKEAKLIKINLIIILSLFFFVVNSFIIYNI
jgi:hypothetical protein